MNAHRMECPTSTNWTPIAANERCDRCGVETQTCGSGVWGAVQSGPGTQRFAVHGSPRRIPNRVGKTRTPATNTTVGRGGLLAICWRTLPAQRRDGRSTLTRGATAARQTWLGLGMAMAHVFA